MPPAASQTINRLRELVQTPSVSSPSPAWDQGNRQVVDILANWLADLGFSIDIQAVNDDGSKANLIATLGSGPGGLVLAGHTDTVPFDEGLWNSNPLDLTERDNRLYGLGSTDMKGFFPLVLAAAESFRHIELKQPLIVLATADEESSMNGAKALAAAGKPKARAAIIGEPTGLTPIRMHKGIMMEAVRVVGHSGHSSNPDLGNSALDGMHAVLTELLTFRDELKTRHRNPAFEVDFPTLNLGCIHGGDSPNRICGQTELHFDLRMVPGVSNDTLREQIRQRLNTLGDALALDISLHSLIDGAEAFEQPADCELVKIAERLTGHSALAVAFATEAPFMQKLGMEAIVMGPGSIDQAHQPDEYLELEQIGPCITLLEQFIRHYCL